MNEQHTFIETLNSLIECEELWFALGEAAHRHERCEKDEVRGPWQKYRHNCPCCEFVFSKDRALQADLGVKEEGGYCKDCPMFEQWMFYCDSANVDDVKRENRYICLYGKSPYNRWSDVIEMGETSQMLWYDLEFFCLLIAELAGEAIEQHLSRDEHRLGDFKVIYGEEVSLTVATTPVRIVTGN